MHTSKPAPLPIRVGRMAVSRTRSVVRKVARKVARARRKRVIGIVGFFGHGNYGDELFLEVFQQYLGSRFELRVIPDLPTKPYFSTPVEDRVREVDAIVIGGGDLVRPWAVDTRYFHPAYLEKPVFMIGLGVPIRTDDPSLNLRVTPLKRYRNFFLHPNVKYVGVRDEISRKWVEENIEPTAPLEMRPDIVCSLDLPPVSKPEGAPILGIVTRLRPKLDTPDDYRRLEDLARTYQEKGWRIRHIILGTGTVGERDLENADDLRIDNKELVYKDNLDDLSRTIGECSVLASMKFHGSVVATMYGVPSIVLIPTQKNRSFMRRLDRGDLLSKFNDPEMVNRFGEDVTPHDMKRVEALKLEATTQMIELRGRIRAAVR